MNILVTGAAGYIGSFMTKRLLNEGYHVMTLDSLERGRKDAVDPRARFIQGSTLDKAFVAQLFNEYDFDSIVHFAGFISMEESMREPALYFEHNTLGTLNLLEEARKKKIKVIFSSTAGIYGNPQKIPIPEDHPTNPENPYGESKLMVEKILSWYNRIYGLPFVSLRYFNAAGGALDGSLGENHNPETHIIPLAIKAALSGGEFFLYGTDYNTPDGTCIRDYIHVLDLVEAHILALSKLEKESGGFYYNVGTGRGFSNREVLQMVEEVSDKKIKIIEKERRAGDAEILVADVERIKKDLGFKPRYSDLKTIVETAWKWHKK